jgi:hypothetical protein
VNTTTSNVEGRMGRMSELESLSDRILRLRMEHGTDPIADLLIEVKAENRATRELLEAIQKKGNGNGKRLWDGAMKVLCAVVTAAIIGGFVWTRSIDARLTRIEQTMPSSEVVDAIRGTQLVVLQRLQELERWRYIVERNP